MSAILVLLALLSISTIATQRGAAAFVITILSTPLLLAVGFVLSSRGLALLPDTTADTLLPAIRVGTAWLALLIGMRAARPKLNRVYAKQAVTSIFLCLSTWGLLAAVVFGLLTIFALTGLIDSATVSTLAMYGAALLLGGVMTGSGYKHDTDAVAPDHREEDLVTFAARHDELCGALALCCGMLLLPLAPEVAPIYTDVKAAVVVVVGLGFTLALAQLLVGQLDRGDVASSRIAIIGLLVFASGLATSASLPDAAIAFFFGAFLATTKGAATLLARGLLATESPVRLAVLALVGVHLGFTWAAVIAGVSIAMVRLVLKLVQARVLGANHKRVSLYAFLSSSGLSIPFAVSFAFTQPEPMSESFVLTATCVAVSVSDLITFFASRRSKATDENTAESTPETDDMAEDAERTAPTEVAHES